MIYRVELDLPANTPASATVKETLSVCYGWIKSLVVLFPPGHAGLTYGRILYHGRQIFPTTSGQWFRGDDHRVEFPDNYPIVEQPYTLEVEGYNLDDTYEHTISFEIYVERPVVYTPTPIVSIPLPEGL